MLVGMIVSRSISGVLAETSCVSPVCGVRLGHQFPNRRGSLPDRSRALRLRVARLPRNAWQIWGDPSAPDHLLPCSQPMPHRGPHPNHTTAASETLTYVTREPSLPMVGRFVSNRSPLDSRHLFTIAKRHFCCNTAPDATRRETSPHRTFRPCCRVATPCSMAIRPPLCFAPRPCATSSSTNLETPDNSTSKPPTTPNPPPSKPSRCTR